MDIFIALIPALIFSTFFIACTLLFQHGVVWIPKL